MARERRVSKKMSRSTIAEYVNTMHKAKKENRILDAPTCPQIAPFGQKFFVWAWWSPDGPYPLKSDKFTILPVGMVSDFTAEADALVERLRVECPVLKDAPICVTDTGYPISFPFNPEPGVKRIFQAGQDQKRAQDNWEKYSAKNQAAARTMLNEAERAKRRMTKQEKQERARKAKGALPDPSSSAVEIEAAGKEKEKENECAPYVGGLFEEVQRGEVGPDNFEVFSG